MHLRLPGLNFTAIAEYYQSSLQLESSERECLGSALLAPDIQPANAKLYSAGVPLNRPQLILSGWAAELFDFEDGRRLIVDFLLPGDLLGFSPCETARALAAQISLTELVLSSVIEETSVGATTLLSKFGAGSAQQKERRLVKRIAGLSQKAHQRAAFLILDCYKRLDRVGLVSEDSFEMPLTQDDLANALGISDVHINRVIQRLRKDQIIEWHKGRLCVLDMKRLSELAGLE